MPPYRGIPPCMPPYRGIPQGVYLRVYHGGYIPGCTSGYTRVVYTRVYLWVYLRVVYMQGVPIGVPQGSVYARVVIPKVYLRVVYMPGWVSLGCTSGGVYPRWVSLGCTSVWCTPGIYRGSPLSSDIPGFPGRTNSPRLIFPECENPKINPGYKPR